jgi:flavin-dependent dehydrogenase
LYRSGAGPAGASAALTLARENLSVLLVERGKYPGAKKSAQGGTEYFHKYQDADYLVVKTANELAYEFFRVGIETNKEKIQKLKEEALSIHPSLNPWMTSITVFNTEGFSNG